MAKIKEIIGIVTDSVPIESQLIALAGWMKKNYGATMNHALKTVIPIKKKSNAVEHKSVRLKLTEIEAKSELAEFERKHQKSAGAAVVCTDRKSSDGSEHDHAEAECFGCCDPGVRDHGNRGGGQ